MRFVIQNVAQRVHERWSEECDVAEKEFACDKAPTLASAENGLSTSASVGMRMRGGDTIGVP